METKKSIYEIYNEYKKLKKAQKKAARQDKLKKGEAEWNKNIEERREADKKRQAERLIKKHPELKDELQHILDPQKTDSTITPETEYLEDDIMQAEISAQEELTKDPKAAMIPSFSTGDVKGIKSFEEMRKVDPKITEKDYQHALNAWYIAQKVGNKIGVDPRLLFGQFGAETLFRDRSVLEQYNYGNIKHVDKSGKTVPQYEGQKPYTDNQNGSEDYYLRFNTIDEAIDWYAQRYAEDGGKRHALKGNAKTDPLAFSQSLYKSGYYEGDPNLQEVQRPIVYQRNIVSQANKWLSDNQLTAQQYTDDPYYTDPVEAIADSKEEPKKEEPKKAKPLVNPYGQNVPLKNMPKGIVKSGFWDRETSVLFNDLGEQSWAKRREYIKGWESVPAADVGIANPNKDKSTSSLFHGGIKASVDGALLAGSNIASLDAINESATKKRKIASADLTAKEEEQKRIDEEQKKIDGLDKATTAANIINATNAAVGLGLGIYGASQINKMQRPSMISAPQIEAAKIRDTGAQAMAAHKGMIEQSANTSRDALRRAGRSDLNATITAGETRALNEAAGAIEGMRTNINAANVAAENRVREINASTKMQADQFNSQIQASFNQFKSQLGSQNLSTTVQNVSANLGGIAQNNYAKALRERDEELQMKIARLIH